MKEIYLGYQCNSHEEWKKIMEYELGISKKFEIHSWIDEVDCIETALKYGEILIYEWKNGVVITGDITEEFIKMILDESTHNQNNGYRGFTNFFSIFLDTGFSSEHYGTEINKF